MGDAHAAVELGGGDGVSGLVVGQAALLHVGERARVADAMLVRLARQADVVVVDLVAPVEVGDHRRLVDDVLDGDRGIALHVGDQLLQAHLLVLDLLKVILDDLATIAVARRRDHDLAVEASRTHQRGVQRVRDVGGANRQHWLRLMTSAHQAERAQTLLPPRAIQWRRVHLHQQFVEAAGAAPHAHEAATAHSHAHPTGRLPRDMPIASNSSMKMMQPPYSRAIRRALR